VDGDREPPVWYANSDDPYYALRHSGGPMVAIAALPAVLVMCFAGPSAAILLALVPVAAVAAVWEYLLDRRKVVEIRLADGEVGLTRANGSTARFPIGDLRRIEVVRMISGGIAGSTRMLLHVGDRVERTRYGPAELPARWAETVTIAEIEMQVREKQQDD
jgi:hypothetical protein